MVLFQYFLELFLHLHSPWVQKNPQYIFFSQNQKIRKAKICIYIIYVLYVFRLLVNYLLYSIINNTQDFINAVFLSLSAFIQQRF